MITATFKLPDIEAYIQQQAANGKKAIIKTFQFAGETFVRNARLNGSYQDITGNLRSSIGYIILVDGKQIDENFQEAENGTDKETGIQIGVEFAKETALSFPKGIVLICVAGMSYAAAVEAKGKEVITGSSLELSSQLKQLLSQL